MILGREMSGSHLPVHLWVGAGLLRSLTSIHTAYMQVGESNHLSLQKGSAWLKIGVIPIVVTTIFFGIYLGASPAFAEKLSFLSDNLEAFFREFNIGVVFSLVLGGLIGIWAILKPAFWPEHWNFGGYAPMVRRKQGQSAISSLSSGLRTEFRTANLLLLSVNALLVAYHAIDIPWIWFQYDTTLATSASHSQLVHEGTWLLIASILLSMGIMLYYFRGNLNFFGQSGMLRKLSYLWIAQNALLVVSVAVRNYHYIAFDGLTYKRIGVIIFLAMCLFGLATLAIKIAKGQSLQFLIGRNLMFGLILGIGLSALPWARWITLYNLHHYEQTGRIDLQYLSDLDDTNLDLLWEIDQQTNHETLYPSLRQQMDNYLEVYRERGWRSYTLTGRVAVRNMPTQSE